MRPNLWVIESYTPRVPRLEVSVNGRRAWFYQHPKLVYIAPRYAVATITTDIPTPLLNQGSNKLVLTAIDEPGTRDDSEGMYMVPGNSGIYYDALRLDHEPKGS